MVSSSQLQSNSTKLERALLLSRHGYAVLPHNNKVPLPNATVAAALGIPPPAERQGGVKLATRDPQQIRMIWTTFPDASVGIACGAASGGLIVLDVDRKNGKDGAATLAANGLQPPPTAFQDTLSGGRHWLYRDQTGRQLPNDAGNLGVGLDWRGDGGFIADYGFDPWKPLASAPDWLLAQPPARQHDTGVRRPLGDPDLSAPSYDEAVRALTAHDPNNMTRDQWISVTSAFKQAIWNLTTPETVRFTWEEWCRQYKANDTAENNRQWNSIRETTVGWPALLAGSPARAKLLFCDDRRSQQMQENIQIGDDATFGTLPPVLTLRGSLKKRWVISTGYDSFGFARFDGVHDGLDRNHPAALCPADGTLCKRHDRSGMGTG